MFWSRYGLSWWTAVLVGVCTGLAFAVVHLSAPELLLIGGGMAVLGVVHGLLVRGFELRGDRRRVLMSGLLHALPTVAVGLVHEFGYAGLLATAALGLGGLPLHQRHRLHTRVQAAAPIPAGWARPGAARLGGVSRRHPAGVGASGTDRPPPVSTSSTAQLCHDWRLSHRQLQCTGGVDGRHAVVRLRARYLDELERRDPTGFARWLAGARADTDPAPFITSPRRH
ncbi:hypothetical protein ACI8AC_07515 [Geodermatophilus sp. SYSU D00758]